MQLIDDRGVPIDAEYTAEADGGHLAIILESMSGESAARAARNTDYRPALELLLARLRDLDAVVEAAVVDSLATQRRQIPEADRALLPGPVRLADEPNLPALRRRLTNAQMTIGQASDARRPGNSTKRIRLRLAVPGYGVDDADASLPTWPPGWRPSPTTPSRTNRQGKPCSPRSPTLAT